MHWERIPLSKSKRRRLNKQRIKAKRKLRRVHESKMGGKIGYVYVFSIGEDFYKIGKSVDYKDRLYDLQASNLYMKAILARRVPDMNATEKLLHAQFGEHRVSREVFHLTDDHLAEIDVILVNEQQSLVHPSTAIPNAYQEVMG